MDMHSIEDTDRNIKIETDYIWTNAVYDNDIEFVRSMLTFEYSDCQASDTVKNVIFFARSIPMLRLLIKKLSPFPKNAIQKAVRLNRVDIISVMLEENIRDNLWLDIAVKDKLDDMIIFLTKKGLKRSTALFEAALLNDIHYVRLLINQGVTSPCTSPSKKALMVACANDNIDIISELLKIGVVENKALIITVRNRSYFATELLLKYKMTKTKSLVYAVRNNDIHMARLLLSYNIVSCTALIEAVTENNIEMAKLLLDFGIRSGYNNCNAIRAAEKSNNMLMLLMKYR